MPDHACDFIFGPLHCNNIACILSHLKNNEKSSLYIFFRKAMLGKDFSALSSCCFLVDATQTRLFCNKEGKILSSSLKQGYKSGFFAVSFTTMVECEPCGGWDRQAFWCQDNQNFTLPSVSDSENRSLIGNFLSRGGQVFCLFTYQVQNRDFHLPYATLSTRDYWSQLMPCWDANNSCGKPHGMRHGANAPRVSFHFLPLWSLGEKSNTAVW